MSVFLEIVSQIGEIPTSGVGFYEEKGQSQKEKMDQAEALLGAKSGLLHSVSLQQAEIRHSGESVSGAGETSLSGSV